LAVDVYGANARTENVPKEKGSEILISKILI